MEDLIAERIQVEKQARAAVRGRDPAREKGGTWRAKKGAPKRKANVWPKHEKRQRQHMSKNKKRGKGGC